MKNALKTLLYICFFISGACGLVYEVLWSRYLGMFIGNSTYANAIVLAAFMGGLALGNYWIGRKADKNPKSLSAYGYLEIGIGAYAIVTPLLLFLDRMVFVWIAAPFGIGSIASLLLKLIFAFPIVLIPATLMGGTLPYMAKVFIGSGEDVRREIGALYAINSLGAVIGSLACAFILIPALGLSGSIYLTAFVNLAVAMVVFWIRSQNGSESLAVKSAKAPAVAAQFEQVSALQLKAALIAICVSGAIAMFYELAWFRLFALILGSSTYSFALMLSAFIAGITVGSLIVTFVNPGGKGKTFNLLYLCHWAVGGFMVFSMLTYEHLPFMFVLMKNSSEIFRTQFYVFEWAKYWFAFSIMFIPTTIFGMILPLTTLLACSDVNKIGEEVGGSFAINTIGATLGSLLAGFLLLPYFSMKGTFATGAILNVSLAVLLYLVKAAEENKLSAGKIGIAFGSFAFTFLLGVATPAWSATILSSSVFRKDFNFTSWTEYPAFRASELAKKVLYYKDGTQVTVLVGDNSGNIFLKVNGKTDASTSGDVKTQLLLAHLPALLHKNPKKALDIGIGSGMTCGAILLHPSIERLDVAEISKEVREACVLFKDYNHAFYNDPRTKIYIEDAKTFMQLTKEKYDMIVSEPSNPWVAGVASLYTDDFFKQVKSHLNDDGVFAQWFHAYEMSEATSQVIIRTLHKVFPHVGLWSVVGSNDVIFIASKKPIEVDYQNIAERLKNPALAEQLDLMRVHKVPTLLAQEMTPPTSLDKILDEGPINSDNHPYLEYEAPKDFFLKDRAMEFYYDNDEKQTSIAREGLMIKKYMKEHQLTDEDYADLHDTFKSEERDTGRLEMSLAMGWKQAFPNSQKLKQSKILENEKLIELEKKVKESEAAMKRAPNNSYNLVEYLLNYFNYYYETRSIFYKAPMENWNKLYDQALTAAPDKKRLLLKLRSLISKVEGA